MTRLGFVKVTKQVYYEFSGFLRSHGTILQIEGIGEESDVYRVLIESDLFREIESNNIPEYEAIVIRNYEDMSITFKYRELA